MTRPDQVLKLIKKSTQSSNRIREHVLTKIREQEEQFHLSDKSRPRDLEHSPGGTHQLHQKLGVNT